jgi:ATP phosphoribosyltransferase regulatory subunit
MTMNGSAHTRVQVPPGVQCFVGDEARRRRRIEDLVVSVFEGWSYEEIIPPLFDYADVFGGDLSPKTYSFVGRDGSLLALRPDFTSLLAKIAAGRLADRPAPMRLYYSGEVLRYEPPKAGRQSELYQMGCEHLGGRPPAADAEILALASECLSASGVRDFVLSLGHVGVFSGVVTEARLENARVEALRARIESKDEAGVREALAGSGIDARAGAALERLASLAGDPGRLQEAFEVFAFSASASAALGELREVLSALAAAGLADRLALDLGEVRGLDYYTGLVFRAYAPGLGFEVASGGRYDTLLERFGRPLPAVGFMIGLDRLALLLERQGGNQPIGVAHAEPVPVGGDDLGGALRAAREKRRAGTRVRLLNGGGR